MRDENLVRLFTLLQGDTPEEKPQALMVGGCVRNTLLNKEVEDIDIATPRPPSEVMRALEEGQIKVIPTGLDHGTVTAVINGNAYEITTLRQDEETDGRHATVSFTKSWIDDARRRDFTINTLLMDLNGNIYDPLGQGMDDIRKKAVRFVGDPEKRIQEDYLRILRFFRFSGVYGNGFDKSGLKACAKHAEGIDKLSKERITQEFFKIIISDEPAQVLESMFAHNILSDMKADGFDAGDFQAFCDFQKKYRLISISSRLWMFAACDITGVNRMKERVLFPKVVIRDIQNIQGALKLRDLSCDHAVKEGVYRFGRVATAQALLIELVQNRVMNRYAPVALGIIQNWDIPTFPVTGNDLIAQGMKKGPEIGEMLETLENHWIDQGFKPDREMCLSQLLLSRR